MNGTTAREGGSTVDRLHRKWSSDLEYRAAYNELGPEFDLARSIILFRTEVGLTQAEFAKRMNTTQSVIARLEAGRTYPSIRRLTRVAQATGTRLRISFEPQPTDLD